MDKHLGQYDIAIVGLGVAGSNFASLISPHFKVIAIDKKYHSGDCFDSGFHKPCGGLLSQGAQKALAKQGLSVPKDVLVCPQIFAINTIDYGFLYASYIQKCYVNMDRHRFDLWLKSKVSPHIQVWHNATFKRIEPSDEGYEIYFKHNEKDAHFLRAKARFIIGADGANSHIRRFAYPHLKIPFLVCIQMWFKEQNMPLLSCIFDTSLTKSYSWTMSKDGYFIVGGAYPYKNANRRFLTQLERLKKLGFKYGDKIKQESCWVLQPKRLKHIVRGHSGIFLLGEAAGFINASTLEGISGALHSARILSEVFNNAIDKHTISHLNSKILNTQYIRATRWLTFKTLIRHYIRYPFMFVPCLRRLILRIGILRVKSGLENGQIV